MLSFTLLTTMAAGDATEPRITGHAERAQRHTEQYRAPLTFLLRNSGSVLSRSSAWKNSSSCARCSCMVHSVHGGACALLTTPSKLHTLRKPASRRWGKGKTKTGPSSACSGGGHLQSCTLVSLYSCSSPRSCFTLEKSKSSPVPRRKMSRTSRQVVSKWVVASYDCEMKT